MPSELDNPGQASADDNDVAETARASAVREIVFAPIGGEGLAQQAVRRLGEAIGLGLLQPGDRLPPESQLAEWFGISALTLREALAILRQAGNVETRRGRGGGTFIRRGPSQPSASESRKIIERLTPELLEDFTDHRRAVSGAASALAARRATPEEAAHIEQLALDMTSVTKFQDYRRLDASFHIAIASASRSSRLATAEAKLQIELGEVLGAMFPLMTESGDLILGASNREHRRIAKAIRKGDAEEARQAVRTHVAGSKDIQLGMIATTAS